MCTVFEETRAEGIIVGRTEGRAEEIISMGYEFGLSEKDILGKLQSKLNVSLEKANEYLFECCVIEKREMGSKNGGCPQILSVRLTCGKGM